jgi:hypothetical protein
MVELADFAAAKPGRRATGPMRFCVRACPTQNKEYKTRTTLQIQSIHPQNQPPPTPSLTCKVRDPFGRSLLQRTLIVIQS